MTEPTTPPVIVDSKPWYFSKTVVSQILAAMFALYGVIAANSGLPQIPDFVFAVLAVFGIYGRVTATKKIA